MANYHIKPIAWKTGTQTPGSPNLENGDGVLYSTLLWPRLRDSPICVSPIPNLICFSVFPHSQTGGPIPQSLTWVYPTSYVPLCYPNPQPMCSQTPIWVFPVPDLTSNHPKQEYGMLWLAESCMFALFMRIFWGEIPGFIYISPGTI